jgi:hypothetical protein
MSLPEPIIALLASFQPVFTTPTWQKMLVLLIGTLLARGRRTVTVALRQMGLEQSPQASQISPLAQSGAMVADAVKSLLARRARRDVWTGWWQLGARDR